MRGATARGPWPEAERYAGCVEAETVLDGGVGAVMPAGSPGVAREAAVTAGREPWAVAAGSDSETTGSPLGRPGPGPALPVLPLSGVPLPLVPVPVLLLPDVPLPLVPVPVLLLPDVPLPLVPVPAVSLP
jgi:hypothetical protein